MTSELNDNRDAVDAEKSGSLPSPDDIRHENVAAKWSRALPDVVSVNESADAFRAERPRYEFAPLFASSASSAYSFALPDQTNDESPSRSDARYNAVECQLCPRGCVIRPGRVGACGARINREGRLFSRIYGRPISTAIDPIEKKPLYHFLPGTPILSLGARGCNLTCQFCQNWTISRPLPPTESIPTILPPEQVVELARARGCRSVAFTYNEPTIWAEYAIDVARLCRQAGIFTVAVTNGMISGRARADFYSAIDAANVDLKAFTESFYRSIAGGRLEDVKSTLEYIAQETNVWLEITNLLVPTLNDSENDLRKMCQWIVETLGTNIPLHFSAFFPRYKITNLPPTPIETLRLAYQIAKDAGVSYVYFGNVDDEGGNATFCPNCGEALIKRSARYQTKILDSLSLSRAEGETSADSTNSNDRSTKSGRRARCGVCGTEICGFFS